MDCNLDIQDMGPPANLVTTDKYKTLPVISEQGNASTIAFCRSVAGGSSRCMYVSYPLREL
jgi:hypothetical protein